MSQSSLFILSNTNLNVVVSIQTDMISSVNCYGCMSQFDSNIKHAAQNIGHAKNKHFSKLSSWKIFWVSKASSHGENMTNRHLLVMSQYLTKLHIPTTSFLFGYLMGKICPTSCMRCIGGYCMVNINTIYKQRNRRKNVRFTAK